MKISKILIPAVALWLGILVKGMSQDHFHPDQEKPEYTNLFEYGMEVNSCEDNFKNLFRNFPRFIKNDRIIDLLSYEFVGEVKNSRKARKYLRKNLNTEAPTWGFSSRVSTETSGGDTKNPKSSVRLRPTPWKESPSQLKDMVRTISEEYVEPGDKVYKIRYVLNFVSHEYFVFVDPETFQVRKKANHFSIDVPVNALKEEGESL